MSQEDPFATPNNQPKTPNPGNYNPSGYQPGQYQEAIPNSTAVLVLGIISIATCWLYGVPGIICGIIALILAKSASSAYEANPEKYTTTSFNNLKAGKICGLIGLILSVLFIVFIVVYFIFIFAAVSSFPRYY